MFKQVLVPVDGSSTSTAALHHAIDIAKQCGASITALTAYDPFPIVGAGMEYALAQESYQDAVKAETNKTITVARELIETQGIKANVMVTEAREIWRAILDTADKLHADLIVMGCHGRTGLEKLMLGSVTQRVLQHTHVPVLVVRD